MSNVEDKKASLQNWLGVFLVFGIMLGIGVILIRNDNSEAGLLQISEPPATVAGQVKGIASESKISINTATLEELEKLKGIGPATAQKIIDYREDYGPFKKIEDIVNVSGIGEGKFGEIKDMISV